MNWQTIPIPDLGPPPEPYEYAIRSGDTLYLAGQVALDKKGIILENPYPPSKEGLMGHFHADKTHNALDRLKTIAAPTLITSGELDWQVPTRYGLEVQQQIPDATIHVFRGPHSSHIAFYEIADEWNEFTLAWLKSQKMR